MKILYMITLVISFIALLIVYFSNILISANNNMFLGSATKIVSMGEGLIIVIILSYIAGASTVLLIKSLGKKRGKGYDEFDL